MKLKSLALSLSVIAFAAACASNEEPSAVYGASAPAQEPSAASGASAPVTKKQPFSALDTDNDGMLSRIEAAADPDAGMKFETLDEDKDQKLSRSEYEAWEGPEAGAATGSTVRQ